MIETTNTATTNTATGHNYAYLDETSKRAVRRGILKALAVPGYQVPFAVPETPLAYGWGVGGVVVTASLIGPADVLKVSDHGADDTANAVSIRRFFETVAHVKTTSLTPQASLIQVRQRVPETPLQEGQILIYQVPRPDPLKSFVKRAAQARRMHANADYGLVYVRLYEQIAKLGGIRGGFDYPLIANGRHLMSPSPIPKFDNPRLNNNPGIQLFGAARERRLYALPPYTQAHSIDLEDHPFTTGKESAHKCAICGSGESYLDRIILDDAGHDLYACSDTECCTRRLLQKEQTP